MRSRDESWYDTAEICLNGHVFNSMIKSVPEQRAKRCDQCGAETITKCAHCGNDIRGHYHIPGVLSFDEYIPPAYCHECGSPYPWRQTSLQAVQQLIDMAQLSDQEKQAMKDDLPALLTDMPTSKVAATRMRQFMQKAGSTVGSALKDILVSIASEAAKKVLFPGS